MLIGLKRPALNTVMAALDRATYTFHLTGSRCFGYENKESDWDFFVGMPTNIADVSKLHEWLKENGFRKESNDSYIPRSTDSLNESLEVWIHGAADVHIQIVRDAASKLEIQETMKRVPRMTEMLKSLSKENRKAIWKMGRAIFEAGQRCSVQRNVSCA
jgi:hypothetical protein